MATTPSFKLLLYTFLGCLSFQVHGQDFYEKLSKKLCSCLEREKIETADQMPLCYEQILFGNMEEIKKHYQVASLNDIDAEALGSKVAAQLLKHCDYALKVLAKEEKQEKKTVTKQANLTCKDLRSGDFYYLNEISNQQVPDTTHVTISGNMFLERMKGGRTFSLLNIEWTDDCNFVLVFKESNDPLKEELSKPGDEYVYEVMTNGPESFVLKLFWKKEEFQIEVFKSK
ncbi:MAG: hypothetical protein AAF554_13860 [Bacteroidota bacterium]